MLWKIYFWILFVILILALIRSIQYEIAFIDFVSMILMVFLLIATYSYSFKKSALSPSAWAVVLIMFIATSIIEFVAILAYPSLYDANPLLKSKIVPTPTSSDYWFGILILLPSIYACYQLSSFATKKSNPRK